MLIKLMKIMADFIIQLFLAYDLTPTPKSFPDTFIQSVQFKIDACTSSIKEAPQLHICYLSIMCIHISSTPSDLGKVSPWSLYLQVPSQSLRVVFDAAMLDNARSSRLFQKGATPNSNQSSFAWRKSLSHWMWTSPYPWEHSQTLQEQEGTWYNFGGKAPSQLATFGRK